MDKQPLSGLEILEKFKDGIFPDPTMAVTIPMKIMAVDKGSIEFKAVASDNHLNPMGGVHGGLRRQSLILQQELPFTRCSILEKVTAPLI